MEKINVDDLKQMKVELPTSVTDPKPQFKDSESALQYYGQQLEAVATGKKTSVEDLKLRASRFEFGPEESLMILSLFDTIRALKASR